MVRQEPAKLLSPSSNLGVAFFNAKNKVNKVFAKLFKRKIDNFIKKRGRLAQLVAHLNDIQGVTSSSLVSPSYKKTLTGLFFVAGSHRKLPEPEKVRMAQIEKVIQIHTLIIGLLLQKHSVPL